MEFIVLIVFIVIMIFNNISKSNKLEIFKQELEKSEKLNEDLINKNKVYKDNIKDLKTKNLFFSELIEDKEKEISVLKTIINQLEEKLKFYTDIEKDSMNLNVADETEKKDYKLADLNPEKQKIYELMENTNTNLFITGKAGTGKSYLLKYFKNNTSKKVLYTAPTGIAALNIGGVTLHSVFGFNNLIDDSIIKLSQNKRELLKTIDTLVIDEISMVRVDVFNQIDLILRKANNSYEPFGGKQIILLGDLFQLPPVVRKDEVSYLNNKYKGIFFFNSKVYDKANFRFYELNEVFRQNDNEFKKVLNNIREGKIGDDEIDFLNQRYTDVPKRILQVVPTKEEANIININNLNSIEEKEYIYEAEIIKGNENVRETDFPCEFNLKLKVGTLVMMISNDQENKRWVNGTLGIVSELKENYIKVTINGISYEINKTTFNKYKCEYNQEENKIEYVIETSVSQYPIILAYAITIHKSQGMTYQQIAVNLENCFAPGQAYVALSRCSDFDKLYLINKVKRNDIITNDTVIKFYNNIKN